MPLYLEKWVEDKARRRLTRETDIIETEWPAHTGSAVASGYFHSADPYCTILMSVPSGFWFKPRMVWLRNSAANNNELHLYNGGSLLSCSATIGGFFVPVGDNQFIGLDCITVGKDIWASALHSGMAVRIGGLLIQSGPEN